jgi:osmotically-inducible protein OsmY
MTTLSQPDLTARNAVLRQLARDPRVDASAVAASVHDGAVTLTGFVDSCAAKLAAERAAKRVPGICAVANDIQVRQRLGRTDADIAADIAAAIKLRPMFRDSVQATVHQAHVTLTGSVNSPFVRDAASTVMETIPGIKGVTNRIVVFEPESEIC